MSIGDLNIQSFSKILDSSNSPDPDLLIRTSGENRLSDFLLYQSSYTCLYFDDVLWPDYNLWHLSRAILYYQMHYSDIENKMLGSRTIIQFKKSKLRIMLQSKVLFPQNFISWGFIQIQKGYLNDSAVFLSQNNKYHCKCAKKSAPSAESRAKKVKSPDIHYQAKLTLKNSRPM
uniref:ditrans,polycis-polyprenyl diphosphate synthase [(2E,6E)-farnesyldiphosphate specific] n=1 Tax=Romanomermis culicivorax TaxID=13658 RepID=A0A915I746_ROMCU